MRYNEVIRGRTPGKQKGERMEALWAILMVAGLVSGLATLLILILLRAGKQADEEREWALWRKKEEESSDE